MEAGRRTFVAVGKRRVVGPLVDGVVFEFWQYSFDTSDGLIDPLLVLDQRESDVTFTAWAKADARRRGHLGLADQLGAKLDASH